ncbi:MAG: hypothetical protein QNJ68_18145 [Microcoleaceae cyanobacterium MO_207.B10]|nr:hypothetical protein [Microcoleaceae cyanobacterium MO_207.B10]
MTILDDVKAVVNSDYAAALSLSKGGWEGWLQCQLWGYLSLTKGVTVEREVYYPNSAQRCDLVVGATDPKQWIELKACGVFREGGKQQFLDKIAYDLFKLMHKPNGSTGLVLVVVPKTSVEWFESAKMQRRWDGFQTKEASHVNLYYLTL